MQCYVIVTLDNEKTYLPNELSGKSKKPVQQTKSLTQRDYLVKTNHMIRNVNGKN